jgi:hypothetical protein
MWRFQYVASLRLASRFRERGGLRPENYDHFLTSRFGVSDAKDHHYSLGVSSTLP